MKTCVSKETARPATDDIVWTSDLGKGSIGEAVQDFFRVTLANGHSLLCKPSGKLFHVNRIRSNEGDKVRVSLSEYDLSRGTITYRL
jgi:translation initiation factor IF-1